MTMLNVTVDDGDDTFAHYVVNKVINVATF